MKKILLLSIILFNIISSSKASHNIGGEMGWTCLANGKYIFYLVHYRDCTGVQHGYQDETIEIVASSLPKDEAGIIFDKILLKPDSNRWNAENNGDISPRCSNLSGNNYSCEDRDRTVQQFLYKSDPITMNGIPPSGGWKFFWNAPCCRPNSLNVNTIGLSDPSVIIRATMYSTKNKDNANPCIDSSPKFINPPTSNFCRGSEVNRNDNATDSDLDSLVFLWDRPISPPFQNPILLDYKNGFSPNNPTPDASFDSRNIASTIDSVNGQMKMAIYSGAGTQRFLIVTKVESYREGIKIAEVFREIPIWVTDCNSLPNGKANQPPNVIINGDTTQDYVLEVTAGQAINIPIEVIDTDYWDSLNTQQQVLSLQPEGLLFSRDRASSTPCQVTYGAGQNLGVEPCAYMENLTPSLDTSKNPPKYTIQDTGSISTNFSWQTDCRHLVFADNGEAIFNFVFAISDDHCPIPAKNGAVITVRLQQNNTSSKPRLTCLKSNNGVNELSWSVNSIDTVRFKQIYVFGGDNNNNFFLIDSVSNPLALAYTDSSLNGYEKYFINSKSTSCLDSITFSQNSDTISLKTDSLKVENRINCIQLSWEEARSSFGKNESRSYLIYRENSPNSGFQLIDSVINKSSFCDYYSNCGAQLSYYVDGGNNTCNFRVDTVSVITNSTVASIGVEVLDTALVAFDTLGNYQWYDCDKGKNIKGETSRIFTPKDTGEYAVIIQQFACKDTSACIPFFPVSLDELSLQEQVTLYPNPTSGKVQINIEESAKELTVQVRNIQGQLMKEERFNEQSFQMELPKPVGIYFIQLTNQKGERANLKVVKQ